MRLHRPSPAMLVALLALFVALGGSSYAALQLPKGSVGTKQLRNGVVTSKKVKNKSLLLRDFNRSARTGLRGERGPAGPTGPPGPTGTVDTSNFYTKAQSDARYLRSTVVVVKTLAASIDADDFETTTVDCPAGYQAVGGGVDPNGVFFGKVSASAPLFGTDRPILVPDGQRGPATGWWGAVTTQGTATGTGIVKIAVICSPIG
jgi:hypothetical protein